jgi:predicted dehydrogenase
MVHERDELFVRQAHAFLDAVDDRAEVLCPLSEAEHVLRVNLAALQSAAEGRVVSLTAAR